MTAAVSRRSNAVRAALIVGIAAVAAMLINFGPRSAAAATQQAWPPFALVTGLLLIGRAAAMDHVFAAAGTRVARLPGGPAVLLAASLGLVAIVTAVLNLDTAVVFLTPVLIETARARGLDDRAFVYGTVLMSNSASLLLPGSNLTNLLVLDGSRVSGLDFARNMFAPWLVAIIVTWLLLWIVHRRRLSVGSTNGRLTPPFEGRIAVAAVAGAAGQMLVLPDPAIPVLLLGLVVTLRRRFQGRLDAASLLRTAPLSLVGLFVFAVCCGTLARLWAVPAMVIMTAGRLETLLLGALGSLAINNLPAASLLSSHPLAHPYLLLLGLNLGPNLVITGALSAVLWLRIARQNHADVSAWMYTRLGLLVVPLSLALAAETLVLVHPAA
jgi:arsenical pump membrane protein